MAKPQHPIPADVLTESHSKQLAEKMALLLNNEDVSDVTIAIALLTSGVVHQYAGDLAKARELLGRIHRLEDRFVSKALGIDDHKLN